MILFRYLAKEVYVTLAAITGILLFIVISNQLVIFLTRAAAGKIPVAIVFKLVFSQIPYFCSFLLPLGFFLSILMAYGRLYIESEMVVLAACGMSQARLLGYTLLFSLGIFLTVFFLTFWINPQLESYKHRIEQNVGPQTLLQTIAPGRFQNIPGGNYVVYVGGISRDHNQLQDMFIADEDAKTLSPQGQVKWNVMSAHGGTVMDEPEIGQFIVIQDGKRYSGLAGQKNYTVTQFHQFGVRLSQSPEQHRLKSNEMPTRDLIRNMWHDKQAAGEMEERISMPICIPLLTLLAVPLSRVSPRQGKFMQLVPAILLYIIYANMILINQSWIHKGIVSPAIGMWWIHAVVLIIAGILLLRSFGWSRAHYGLCDLLGRKR